MTDEERLHMITEQLLIVRDNLFRGMSKSIQKLQARSINEVLELPNFIQSHNTWIGLTNKEIEDALPGYRLVDAIDIARSIEAKLKDKNT